MTRKERLEQKLAETRVKLTHALAAGKLFSATQLEKKINELRDLIAEAAAYEPAPLGQLLPPGEFERQGFAREIIKIHMAADFLTDVAMVFREHLRRNGLEGATAYTEIKDIEDRAAQLAAQICKPEYGQLSDFMTTNDELIDGLHAKCDSYLDAHLNIHNEPRH